MKKRGTGKRTYRSLSESEYGIDNERRLINHPRKAYGRYRQNELIAYLYYGMRWIEWKGEEITQLLIESFGEPAWINVDPARIERFK